jgi:GNAT superfamily N-acetyltransferase
LNARPYTVRQADERDLPRLTEIKAPLAIHRDRLRDADAGDLLYLVIEDPYRIVGFGLLVFRHPPTWPDTDNPGKYPAVVDLTMDPEHRSKGAGSFLIRQMAGAAKARGCTRLCLGADPIDNPRAYALYLRLGFRPLQSGPQRSRWKFTDSDGNVHEGNEWNVDMELSLAS